jgi:quercetin dioxygenase-like cupin family protein
VDQTEAEHPATAAPGSRPPRRGITVFHGRDGVGLSESGTMSPPVFDLDDQRALAADGPRSPTIALGTHDTVLFRGEGDDGFSLVRAWFGPHFVLPRHSHDGDCLYFIVEGSVVMGSQELAAGDGFFVPSGAPYAYEAGPEGVVVLEFRTRTSFGMNIRGGQLERWRAMAAAAAKHGDRWVELRSQITG